MKKALLLSLISSAMMALVTQTSNGTYIDIYSSADNQSEITSSVSVDKGHIIKKRCFTNSKSKRWCKVKYAYKEMSLSGYTQENLLNSIYKKMKDKSTFEVSYGGRYDDRGNEIIAISGGYLIVGKTASFGKGQDDAYVLKIDKYGNKIYSLALGGSSNDEAKSVVEFEDSYLISGSTRSYGNGVESIYMARITKDGSLLWHKGYYSDEDDYYRANDMIKINNDNLLLVGYENHVQFFNSEVDIYVNAINVNGQRNGIKRYGGDKEDEANSIINVKDGYVIAGMTKTWGHGGEDAYVVKIDKEGNRVWHNAFGFRYDETINEIIQTKDGGYIAVGTTDSDIKSQKDIYIIKMKSDGTRSWHTHYGSKEDDEGYAIVETDGGYVIAGYTKETQSYNSDAYLLKIDYEGRVLWSKKYGLDRDDEFKDIIKTEDGFIATGYLTSEESYSEDVYIVKVNKNGDIN